MMGGPADMAGLTWRRMTSIALALAAAGAAAAGHSQPAAWRLVAAASCEDGLPHIDGCRAQESRTRLCEASSCHHSHHSWCHSRSAGGPAGTPSRAEPCPGTAAAPLARCGWRACETAAPVRETHLAWAVSTCRQFSRPALCRAPASRCRCRHGGHPACSAALPQQPMHADAGMCRARALT